MTAKEQLIYEFLKLRAEAYVNKQGGELRSRQIDAVLRALAEEIAHVVRRLTELEERTA